MDSSIAEKSGGASGATKNAPHKRQRHTPARHNGGGHTRRSEQQQRATDTVAEDDVGVEPSLQKSRTEAKPHSRFVELRRTLVDGAAVADFIAQNHDTSLRDPRQLNGFLQALSNTAEDLFATFCHEHRREVYLALERMFELYSARKVSMSPAAHEFVIRCEQNGVRKAEWAAGLTPDGDATTAAAAAPGATEGTSPSSVTATARAAPSLMMLLSPRELLKKIAVIDPRGRLERMMEMSTSVVDLQTCARKLQVAVDAADANSNSFDYATTCQLVSKLVSKARRTCGAALLEEAPRLSSDDAAALHGMMDILLAVTERALSTRPPSASQQPIAKLAHFTKWCENASVLDARHTTAVAALEQQAAHDLGAQAAQLETVMRLKALPHGDEAAVQQALDDIWDEAAGHFTPCSADVLSAIAVAASSSSMSDAFRTRVAERLIMTSQRRLQDSGQQLPRRALKFVNAVQSREKQESIRRMLAAQENGA